MQIKLLKAVLNLFEGEGGGSAGTGSAAMGDTGTSHAASGKQGELSNVVYGIQDADPDAVEATVDASPEQTKEDRQKAYKDFIAQNKDIHDAEFQKVFDKRFKDYKQLQTRANDQQNLIDRMASRYGIENGDLTALAEAMDNDDAYYERFADENGMTVEQAKRLDVLQRENARLMRTEQERMSQQEAVVAEAKKNQQVQAWMAESESVKQLYPGFDLETEIANPRFQAMLKAGVPIADAYRSMHFDEIMAHNAQETAAQTEKAVTANIRAKGSRPVENGTISQSSFTVKNDVSRLTKADRAEIAKRVLRGEHIEF